MNNNVIRVVIFFSFLLISTVLRAFDRISVPITLNNPVPVKHISKQYMEFTNWYWPSSMLYADSDRTIEKTKETLLTLLHNYAETLDSQDGPVVLSIIESVKQWQLVRRLPVILDPFINLLNRETNPYLPAGRYWLSVPTEQPPILVVGWSGTERMIEPKLHEDVISVLAQYADASSLADESMVWRIDSRGVVSKLGVGYWNAHSVQAMPGDILYVPLKERMFSDIEKTINELMVELLKNRVVK